MTTSTYERRKGFGRRDFNPIDSNGIIDDVIRDLEQKYGDSVKASRSQSVLGSNRYDSIPVTGPFGKMELDYRAPGDGTRKARILATVETTDSKSYVDLDQILIQHGFKKI